MKVLIVAKTRMTSGVCIGGITAEGENVRIIPKNRKHHNFYNPFEVGQVWDMALKKRKSLIKPHIEDHSIVSKVHTNKNYAKQDIQKILVRLNAKIWTDFSAIFDGMIQTNEQNKCYLCNSREMPEYSVGFYLSDKTFKLQGNRFYSQDIDIKYVGMELFDKELIIPKGTLLRLSLARPFNNGFWIHDRCYLQVSGWY